MEFFSTAQLETTVPQNVSNSYTDDTSNIVYSMSPVERIVFIILYSTMDVIGIVGNSLVVCIIISMRLSAKLKHEKSAMTFINSLGWLDLFVCLILMPFDIYRLTSMPGFTEADDPLHYVTIFLRIRNSILLIEGFILVFVAFERWRLITRPLLAKLTTGNTLFLVGIAVLLTFVVEMSQFVVLLVYPRVVDRRRIRKVYRIVYYAAMYAGAAFFLCLFYIPILVVAFRRLKSPDKQDSERVSEKLTADGNPPRRSRNSSSGGSIPVRHRVSYQHIMRQCSCKSDSTTTTGCGDDGDEQEPSVTDVELVDGVVKRRNFTNFGRQQVRLRSRTTERRHWQMLKMLALVTVLFIGAQLFPISTTFHILPNYVTIHNFFYVQNIGNPIIYFYMNQKFRRQGQAIVNRCLPCRLHKASSRSVSF